MTADYDLQEIKLPRQRQPPKRLSGQAPHFQSENVHHYFTLEYYKVIDTVSSKLNNIMTQDGAVTLGCLESCLLFGHINDTCSKYPELDTDLLRIQLEMFRRQFTNDSVDAATDVLRSRAPEVRKLFSQI